MDIHLGLYEYVAYYVYNPHILIAGLVLFFFMSILSTINGSQKSGKNPFSSAFVQPIGDVVTDQSLRDKVLKQRFKVSKVPENLDAIVIGSGMGGLSVASILSRAGKKVLVLEQHDQAGGCCHTYVDKGFEFDIGVHYIGEMQEHSPIRILCDQITGGGVDYPKLNEIFDVVCLGRPGKHKTFNIHEDRQKLMEELVSKFPEEEMAIKKFMDYLLEAKKFLDGYTGLKLLPKWVSKILVVTGLYKTIFKAYAKFVQRTTEDVVNELTDNEDLKAVLTYCFGDYAVMPSKSSFGLHAVLLNHYLGAGGFYIRGGPSEFVYRTIPVIEGAGGRVLVTAPVSNIILSDKGIAHGVTVRKGDSNINIYAKQIISTAGLNVTFNKLLPKEIAVKSFMYPLIKKIGESWSFMSVFVGLEGSPEELGIKSQNMWAFTRSDVERAAEEFLAMPVEEAANTDVPLLFVSFPSAKDPTWEQKCPGKSTCLIITLANWKWFSRWQDGRLKHRGEDYEAMKNAIGRQAWNQVMDIYPQLQGKEEYFDVGSPLSNKHYLGFQTGEIYGLDHGISRFEPTVAMNLRAKTDIPGLYLSGQDIQTAGFVSSMFSGLFCAAAILNRDLIKDLTQLCKEVNKKPSKATVDKNGTYRR